MICPKCGWSYSDRPEYKHVCFQSMACYTEDAPRVQGSIEAVVPQEVSTNGGPWHTVLVPAPARCPECERLRAEVQKWKDAAIDACARVGSLRTLCLQAAICWERHAVAPKEKEMIERLRKAGGGT